jgi:DNA-binding GntR family transcriptional regulator
VKASDRAHRALVAEILDGTLQPGTLLAEVEQSVRLGVSRTPLREALSRLSAAGLVTAPTGRGSFVTEFSIDDVLGLYQMRRSLEELAARLAARRGDKAVFTQLALSFAEAKTGLMDSEKSINDYYLLNQRFDEAIDESVGNRYLVAALATIRQHALRIRNIARNDIHRLRDSAGETEVICRAIVSHEEEVAAHATHLHLHHSLQHVLAAIELHAKP